MKRNRFVKRRIASFFSSQSDCIAIRKKWEIQEPQTPPQKTIGSSCRPSRAASAAGRICVKSATQLVGFASEIIREKILKFYDKEIPYCCEIEIDSYREEPTIDRIAATIYVARDSQKGILIGHKGEKLKRVGQTAREDMEEFLGKKVFLQLFVKVSDDWRNNERQLRRFGYELE